MKFKVECIDKDYIYIVVKLLTCGHESLIARCTDETTANVVADALNHYDKNVKEI